MRLNLFSPNIETGLELINSKLSVRRLWVCWLVMLSAVFLVHLLTLTISPPWGDEAQIIEHGRLLPFEPYSEWSSNWHSTANRPILFWSYLGPCLQEITYKIKMPLPYGPRLASLLGAMIAATASIGWLLSIKTYRLIALILGLVFLLDYIFSQSYRSARVDCWALAFCFGACWALRHAMSQMQKGRAFRFALAIGGSMAAIAFFIWPSAVLIYPLLLAELIALLREEYSMRQSGASIMRSAAAFAISGLVMTALLLIPIWHLHEIVFNDIGPILRASQPPYTFALQIKNLLDSFKYSQLLPFSALIGFIWGRNRLMAFMALLVFFYILSTRLYVGRLVYLLPYAIGLIGGAYQMPFTLNADAKTRRLITHIGLSLLIVGNISLSMIIRPAMALIQKEGRDPNILFDMGHESVGNGPYRVYLGAWEFYFVGRGLGWQMFNEYVDQSPADLLTLFSSVDYAIFHWGDVDADLASQLLRAGLHFKKALINERQPGIDLKRQFSLGGKPYGPYALYSRQGIN
jgi:MFS family permease